MLTCIGFLKSGTQNRPSPKVQSRSRLDYPHDTLHTCSSCFCLQSVASELSIFAWGLRYGLSKSKNGVKSLNFERSYGGGAVANRLRRRTSDQTVPRLESGRGRCVESLDKGSLLPLSQGEAFALASVSYPAILVKYIAAKIDFIMFKFPNREER